MVTTMKIAIEYTQKAMREELPMRFHYQNKTNQTNKQTQRRE